MAQRFCGKQGEPNRPNHKRFDPRGGEKKQKSLEIQITQAPPTIDVRVTKLVQAGVQDIFYREKLIFSFEGNTLVAQARTWISAFNKQSTVELYIVEPLANNYAVYGWSAFGQFSQIGQETDSQLPSKFK
jgi:hypothetical protein